ncbi:uncharacterized protein LOC127751050 [Frankliniella occidentalis]|uniref:Uncharacterized protein LOC127751050 n=1 Tax=Frankliniella occidentalis TaxID=133901 RepID=A0A9C6XTG4_FRAOC|nr:uncharacterized protein LOC127751050 [Frankliniella occidentalis]
MHYMLCCFSVPLISTLQVLQNDLAFLTFTGAFINLAVFMPLAVLSQRLSDASISVRAGAYSAAMTVRGEETVPVRQALQLVLLAAGRPACLSFKGLGPLTLSSAGNALRAWYSFTNVLVKVG